MADHNEKIASLRWNPLNPRSESEERDDPALAELADSIAAKGVLQPLLVLPCGTIVAGHRRWLAAKLAGLEAIPVVVREFDEADQLEAMLIENHQRKSLNPLQTARTCQALLDRGRSLEAIAKQTGMGMHAARKYLALMGMPDQVQRAVGDYELPLAAVAHLAKLRKRPEDLEAISSRAIAENWLANEVEQAVGEVLHPGRAKPRSSGQPRGEGLRPVKSPDDTVDHLVRLIEDARFFLRRHPEFVSAAPVRAALKALSSGVVDAQQRAGG